MSWGKGNILCRCDVDFTSYLSFTDKYCFIVWTCHIVFIHSSFAEQLDCFNFRSIIDNAAKKVFNSWVKALKLLYR